MGLQPAFNSTKILVRKLLPKLGYENRIVVHDDFGEADLPRHRFGREYVADCARTDKRGLKISTGHGSNDLNNTPMLWLRFWKKKDG